MSEIKTLKELLPDHLKDGLTPAEERILEAAPLGSMVDCRVGDEEKDKPVNAENWGPERIVRAKFLHWICTNDEATKRIHPKGIVVFGIKIEEKLDFSYAEIKHPLQVRYSSINGIILYGASCKHLEFSDSETSAFMAEKLTVNGSLFFRSIVVKGEVLLLGANIGGDLECQDATFDNPISDKNPDGDVLVADRLTVKGGVFLHRITANGAVRLPGADIGGNLECQGAIFKNPRIDKKTNGHALVADGLMVKGNVFLNEIISRGELRLPGAKISGNLECTGLSLENNEGDALSAENMKVINKFFLNGLKIVPAGRVNLAHAEIGQLNDDELSWPAEGTLIIKGLKYESFAGRDTPATADKRLKWLALQPKDNFSPQPYEQLAKVFKQMGHESDARKVLIAKQDALYKYGKLSPRSKGWNWLLGKTIGHGYEPWKAIIIMSIIIVISAVVFDWAGATNQMHISKERVYMDKSYRDNYKLPAEYPAFNPFIYSIESVQPTVSAHAE